MGAFAVYFIGYYPVGAVAVTRANNSDEAKEKVLEALPLELREKNSLSTLSAVRLRNKVQILLDGDY